MNADQLSKLPKDLIIYMVLEFNMDMNDIVSLCSSSKKLNKTLCESKSFWVSKLKKDYNIMYDSTLGDPRSIYVEGNVYFEKLGTKVRSRRETYDINHLLWDASFSGNKRLVLTALHNGADPSSTEPYVDGPTALTNAVLGGHVELFKFFQGLAEYKFNIEEKNILLGLASSYSNLSMVKYLIEEIDIKPNK